MLLDSHGLRARLRLENRCCRCKKKGYWKPEGPEKQPGTTLTAFSGLTFLHTVEGESDWTAAEWGDRLGQGAVWATGTPEVPPGHLIVDSAASNGQRS